MTNKLTSTKIGIIICTHNRAHLLNKTLNSFLQNKNIPENIFTLYIVLNACTDNSEIYINNFKKKTPLAVKTLTEPKPGKSIALNHAISNIRSDFYFFLDDDQLLEPDYLQQIHVILNKNPNINILTGFLMPAWDGSEPDWVHNSPPYQIGIRPFPEYDLGQRSFILKANDKLPSGGNIIVNQKVIAEVGKFSTKLGPTGHNLVGGEDHDFLKRALSKGFHILYNPKLRQFHQIEHERLTLIYMMKKSYNRSYSMIKNKGNCNFQKYMIRKIIFYLFQSIFCLHHNIRFYYCTKLAAAFGEMNASISYKGSRTNE